MKKFIYVVALCALVSCHQGKSDKAINEDGVRNDSSRVITSTDDDLQTQADINAACVADYEAEAEAVDFRFDLVSEALPQYAEEFKKERTVWERYQEAVNEVALCEDYGSSSPMYVSDVLMQGLQIFGEPLLYMFDYTRGKEMPDSKTTFTSAMIADAYAAYIKAVDRHEQKVEYQKALREEQKCWNTLLNCRKEISQHLTGDVKKVYDFATNQMIRTKLWQLKNQNQGLGLQNPDAVECVLSKNCSDKELLEYPGFDKVWAAR